jgi:hypothetical protein
MKVRSLRSGFGSTANRCTNAGSHDPKETSATRRPAAGTPINNAARRRYPRRAMRGATTHASADTTERIASAASPGERTWTSTYRAPANESPPVDDGWPNSSTYRSRRNLHATTSRNAAARTARCTWASYVARSGLSVSAPRTR